MPVVVTIVGKLTIELLAGPELTVVNVTKFVPVVKLTARALDILFALVNNILAV